MKKLLLHISMVMILFGVSSTRLEAAINKFTILKRWDSELQQFNYVIVCLKNPARKLPEDQCTVIKNLIDDECNSVFLFSDTSSNPIEDTSLNQLKAIALDHCQDLTPLMQYAVSKKKPAQNITTKLTHHIPSLKLLDLNPQDIINLFMYPIKKGEQDISVIRERKALLGQGNLDAEDAFLSRGFDIYLKYFDELEKDIEQCKKEIDILLSDLENVSAVSCNLKGYLLHKYPNIMLHNSCALFFLHDFLFYPNFEHLNVFKAILENPKASKIFVFQEYLSQPDFLQAMLLELGYSEVHSYTCKCVENSFKSMDQVFGIIRKALSKNDISEREIAEWQHLLHNVYQDIFNVPAEELNSLIAAELIPELFTNSFQSPTSPHLIQDENQSEEKEKEAN